mgnify:FL=1|tara:strand:- start:139 stop:444 length:306 start_codon:yes stop_codon:yes gene_type:complete
MKMEIEIEYEVIDDEYVYCNYTIKIDDWELSDTCRMSYSKQFDEGHYEWESPNCDLGSLLGLEDEDGNPDYDFGGIVSEIESEIQNWLNENMKNKSTKHYN